MKINLNQRPFLIIGHASQTRQDNLVSMMLDLIMAQPGRWHENWHGHMVSRIAMSGTSSSLLDWCQNRRLTHGGYVISEDVNEFTPWGALLLSREPENLEVARHCLRQGIPCAALSAPEMEIIVLTESILEDWMTPFQDSQHKNGESPDESLSAVIDTIDAIDSSFVENSGSISVGEPSREVRRVAG